MVYMEREQERSNLRLAEGQLDRNTDVPEMHSYVSDPVPDSPVVLDSGRFTVKELQLTWEKLTQLWHQISSYRTLFSDLTRGDLDNFLRFVQTGYSIWLEVYEGASLVGLFCFTHLEKVIDTDAHVIFFDRHLSDKTELCRAVISWMFKKFPLQRMTVDVPTFYYATVRLVKDVGFVQEGERRNATLISGRWSNVYSFGITRAEVSEKCRSS